MVGLTPDLRQKRSRRRDSESTLILPKFIPTMQPTLVDAAPEGSDWLHEIKYDGYRTQIAIGGGEVGPTPATGTTGLTSTLSSAKRPLGSTASLR